MLTNNPLPFKPETLCDATTAGNEDKPLYNGSSYSSVDGKSIPSAY